MAEPEVSLDTALKQVAPAWDDARTERTLHGAQRKRSRRRTRVALTSAAAVLIVLGGAATALRFSPEHAPVAASKPVTSDRTLSFADGSQALLLDASAQVVVERASEAAIDVRLPSGRARFEVSKRADRAFRVVCGEVVVRVLGTGFELAREGERTHVSVLHGRVAVSWPNGSVELGAGESGWFPKPAVVPVAEAVAAAVDETSPANTAEPIVPRARERDRSRDTSWRQHAEHGEFQEAYVLLERDRTHLSDDVEELLLAADAARLSGHAAESVPFLQRVVERHEQDPRAPLAAFTLGGVLMNQLGRPREAAAAYARARAMSPSSALSQDALARQVEAAHRASDAAAARTLALEYLERYPEGRRIQAVRRFGGLP